MSRQMTERSGSPQLFTAESHLIVPRPVDSLFNTSAANFTENNNTAEPSKLEEKLTLPKIHQNSSVLQTIQLKHKSKDFGS